MDTKQADEESSRGRRKSGPRSKIDELLFSPAERIRLDAASPVPLYHQMETVILDRLRSADSNKRVLPTEADLSTIFSVSRATIRKVNEDLSAKGLIRRRPSIGTEIVSRGMAEDLGRLTSFTEQMQARGLTISTQVLDVAVATPPARVLEKLRLKPGENVLSIRRLRGTSEVFPFVLLQSWLPASLGIQLDEDFGKSLYQLMESRYGLHIDWAEEEISAGEATEAEAKALSVNPGATLLVMERLTFASGNTPLEFVRAAYLPQHYKFVAKMKR